MELIVSSEARPLVIAPQTVAEEVAQNVAVILATPKGSVPLDRDFGLDFNMVDTPQPRAKALLAVEIVRQVNRYEPRANVLAVDWKETETEAMDGRLIPLVKIEVAA